MTVDHRHSVAVTVSPLAIRRETQPGITSISDTREMNSPVPDAKEVTVPVASLIPCPPDIATGILPQDFSVTEQVYLRGARAGAAAPVHTVPAVRPATQRRRMKAASRIAYEPATVKKTPIVPWVLCTILGFSLLTVTLYYVFTHLVQLKAVGGSCF